MKIKEDLKNFVENELENIVCGHIEAWCGHYVGMTVKQASYEFDVNYDWRAELEEIKNQLGRELTTNEENYIFKKYLKFFSKNYYESMQEGFKMHTGYYLQKAR